MSENAEIIGETAIDVKYNVINILSKLKTEQLLNILPENLIIVKDSGLWNICEDDISMNELYHQIINESFKDFIIRALINFKNDIKYSERINYDICLSSSDSSYCL